MWYLWKKKPDYYLPLSKVWFDYLFVITLMITFYNWVWETA